MHALTSRWRMVLAICFAVMSIAGIIIPASALASDPHEPDDTLAEAKTVPTDGSSTMLWYEGATATYTGVDWIKFEGTAGSVYRLEIARGTVWSLPDATFHAPDGSVIPYEGGGLYSWIFYATDDGPVYVDLLQRSGFETGSYSVKITGGAPGDFGFPDPYEPDNTFRSAKDLPTDGTSQVRANDAVDLARITVRQGMVYRIHAATDGYSCLASVITTTGSELLVEESARFPRNRYFVAPFSGLAYFYVRNGFTGNSSPYTVSAKEISPSVLRGVVRRSSDQEPVPGARVEILSGNVPAYEVDTPPIATVFSASDGSWSVPVTPDRYIVRVKDPSGVLLPECSGGVIPPSLPEDRITVGEEATVTVDLSLWARGAIAARVVGPDGLPLAGTAVTLYAGESWRRQPIGTVSTGSEGQVEFLALDPRLSYSLSVEATAGLLLDRPVDVPVATGQTATVTVTMQEPGCIVGTVMDESRGIPLAGIHVNAWRNGASEMLMPPAVTDANGRYVIRGLASGQYRLLFTDPAGESGPYGRRWYGTSEYGWDDMLAVTIDETTTASEVGFRDTRPPITLTGVPETWRRGPVEVSFSASDQGWMGAQTWLLRPGSPSPERYAGPFSIAAEGAHSIAYWSEDGPHADGTRNREATQTLTVRIDNTASRTTPGNIRDKTLAVPTVIEFVSDEPLSGVREITWQLNGQSGRGNLLPLKSPGSYILAYKVVDVAGNIEETATVSFKAAASGYVARATAAHTSGASYRADPSWSEPSMIDDGALSLTVDRARDVVYVGLDGSGLGRFDVYGTRLSNLATDPRPRGVGVDAEGNLYTANYWWDLRSLTRDGATRWHFDVGNRSFCNADAAPDGTFWAVPSVGNELFRVLNGSYAALPIGFKPLGIAAANGTVYSIGSDNRVHRLNTNAVEVGGWQLPDTPSAIDVDGDGYVYVSNSQVVRKYTAVGGLIETLAAGYAPMVAVDGDGDVYATGDGTIRRYVHARRAVTADVTSGSLGATTVSLNGRIRPSLAGIRIRLERSSNGVDWTRCGRSTQTTTGGAYTISGPRGSTYYRVVAGEDFTFQAGVSSAVRPLSLTLSTSAKTVVYSRYVTVSAYLRTSKGAALSRQRVTIDRLVGEKWVAAYTANTDRAGRISMTRKLTANTQYRARFAGSATRLAVTSATKRVGVKAAVGMPVTPQTVVRARTFAIWSSLRPRHTSGASSGVFQCQQYVSGRWITRTTASAINRPYGDYSKMVSSVRLPARGRWRVRAVHHDGGHVRTASSYRYITVK